MMAEHELKKKLEREADARVAAAAAAKEDSAAKKTKAAAKAIGANIFLKPTSKRKGPSALPLNLTTAPSKAGSSSVAVEEPKEVETIPLESQERLATPAPRRWSLSRHAIRPVPWTTSPHDAAFG